MYKEAITGGQHLSTERLSLVFAVFSGLAKSASQLGKKMKNSAFALLPVISISVAAMAYKPYPTVAKTAHTLRVSRQSKTFPELARIGLLSVVRLTVRDKSGRSTVLGSGFVVGKNLIVTNVHVISQAYTVMATFKHGRSVDVKGLVNKNAKCDLALVYTDTGSVPVLPLASDKSFQVGDQVMAIGNPEGLSGSVSTGIISSLRNVEGIKVIQTTAPISHGSSGGPLIDLYGRVLGVTSFTVSDGQNLNFAYTSEYIRPLMPHGKISYKTWKELESTASINDVNEANHQKGSKQDAVLEELVEDYNQTLRQVRSDEQDIANLDKAQTNTQVGREEATKALLFGSRDAIEQMSKAKELLDKVVDSPIFRQKYEFGERCLAFPNCNIEGAWLGTGLEDLRFIRPRTENGQKYADIIPLAYQVEDYDVHLLVARRAAINMANFRRSMEELPDLVDVSKEATTSMEDYIATAMRTALSLHNKILSNPLYLKFFREDARLLSPKYTPYGLMGTGAENLGIIHPKKTER